MAYGDSRDIILMTAPTGNDDSNRYRNNLKMFASTDNGVTWEKFTAPMLDDAAISTGYSSVVPLSSGSFLSISEGLNGSKFNVKHRAIGAFTQQSSFARYWGQIPVVQTAAEYTLCQYFDIPQYSLYYNSDKVTLNVNISGQPVRLTDSRVETTISTAQTSLNSNNATTFLLTTSMTLNEITGDASKVILISTQSAQPITLSESTSIPLDRRIRINKTLAGKMMVLYKTSAGWYPDSATS